MKYNTPDTRYGIATVGPTTSGRQPGFYNCVVLASAFPIQLSSLLAERAPGIRRSATLVASGVGPQQGQNRFK